MTVDTARAYDAEARQVRAEHILDAAAELLQRWGYRRLTMDDVATQAGIGKGTIYLHWKTREALFEAVLQRELMALVTDLALAVRQDPAEALPHRMGRVYLLSVMHRPLMRALFTADLDMLGKLVRSARFHAARLDRMRHDFFAFLPSTAWSAPTFRLKSLPTRIGPSSLAFFWWIRC
jgi:AcrR family transcriptional regulator